MAEQMFLKCDNNIKYAGASDADTAAYLNSLTVTYAITNEAGTTITNATGSLTYQTASNGNYLGTVDAAVMVLNSAVPFTMTGTFFLEITATGGGYDDFRRIPFQVAYRQE
jgi:hypothetical protein